MVRAFGDVAQELLDDYPTYYRDALAHRREHLVLPEDFNLPRAFDWAEPYLQSNTLGKYATSEERRDGSQYFSATNNYIRLTTRCVDAGHAAFNSVLVARQADYIATRDAVIKITGLEKDAFKSLFFSVLYKPSRTDKSMAKVCERAGVQEPSLFRQLTGYQQPGMPYQTQSLELLPKAML